MVYLVIVCSGLFVNWSQTRVTWFCQCNQCNTRKESKSFLYHKLSQIQMVNIECSLWLRTINETIWFFAPSLGEDNYVVHKWKRFADLWRKWVRIRPGEVHHQEMKILVQITPRYGHAQRKVGKNSYEIQNLALSCLSFFKFRQAGRRTWNLSGFSFIFSLYIAVP